MNTMWRPNAKNSKLQGDDENIWNSTLDTLEERQHDGQSSIVGDDSEHGNLIGATHIQAQMLVDVFMPK
jgi:hypothetical protein